MERTDVKQNSLKAWLLASRPKTLTGAAVPVMIGTAWAWSDAVLYGEGAFSVSAAVLCFVFAFVMQIDANFINDFFDYLRGTDDVETRLGPRRACAEGWVTLDAMKRAIALTTCLACLVGLPLVWWGGLEMILVGALCVLFCFLYTTHLSYQGWGDALVVLFFGIVPVTITYYVQLHTTTLSVLVSSLACGLVVDGLLLVNNFRDRDTDKVAGKQTLVVSVGAHAACQLYLASGWVPCILGLVFWMQGYVLAFVLPLVFAVFHYFTYLKMKRIWRGRELNECLSETAMGILLYGVLVSLGIVL